MLLEYSEILKDILNDVKEGRTRKSLRIVRTLCINCGQPTTILSSFFGQVMLFVETKGRFSIKDASWCLSLYLEKL